MDAGIEQESLQSSAARCAAREHLAVVMDLPRD